MDDGAITRLASKAQNLQEFYMDGMMKLPDGVKDSMVELICLILKLSSTVTRVSMTKN